MASTSTGKHIGPLFILQFVSENASFRMPEFESVCRLLDVPFHILDSPDASSSSSSSPCLAVPEQGFLDSEALSEACSLAATPSKPNAERPFMLVHLPSEQVVRQLSTRLTSLRAAFTHWATAITQDAAVAALQAESVLQRFQPQAKDESVSWKASVLSVNKRLGDTRRLELIELVSELIQFAGPIDLKAAQLDWAWLEEYGRVRCSPDAAAAASSKPGKRQGAGPPAVELRCIHLGARITLSEEPARKLISRLDLKERSYIGNTSMESEMSCIVANMALAAPNKLIYDPFVGTGSLIYPCAYWGAFCMGSDIDVRMLRGKDGPLHSEGGVFGARGEGAHRTGIERAAEQYGITGNILDVWTADVTNSPLRPLRSGLYDAIVTDPPYGVRAGAKRSGRRDVDKQRDEPFLMSDGVYSHQKPDYCPPLQPYPLRDLVRDLFASAAEMLRPGGRLVFWLPTMTTESEAGVETSKERPVTLPTHPALRLVAHSLQDFGRWGRWLITMERVEEGCIAESSQLPDAPDSHVGGLAKPADSARRLRANEDRTEFRNQFFRNGVK